jgi:hypothetical protein
MKAAFDDLLVLGTNCDLSAAKILDASNLDIRLCGSLIRDVDID